MTRLLAPEADDYIVFKPKHSPFYASPLQTILDSIGARIAIVAGVTTNACVLIAAGDLHVRDFRLFVPCRLCGCPFRARTPALARPYEKQLRRQYDFFFEVEFGTTQETTIGSFARALLSEPLSILRTHWIPAPR